MACNHDWVPNSKPTQNPNGTQTTRYVCTKCGAFDYRTE